MQVDYQSLLSQIRDGVYFTDCERRITYWNTRAEHITGYTADEVIGHRCSENILVHVDKQGRSLWRNLCPLAESIKDGAAREAVVYLHHKLGHRVPVNVRVTALKDGDGNTIGGAEFFTEFNSQEMMLERLHELEQLALLDNLTQLPNRHHIESELSSRFHEKSRMQINFGLIFIDLDLFKTVNDTFGHDIGDTVLRTIANTLKNAIRPFDLVGRWGGEEFIGVIRNTDKNVLKNVAQRLLYMIRASTIQTESSTISMTASLGVTMAEPDDTAESLIKRADALMYKSKQNGRNQITYG